MNKTKNANEIPHVDSVLNNGSKTQVMDTVPPIPKEIIRKEYLKRLQDKNHNKIESAKVSNSIKLF
jgi:hypothetical protein